MSRGKNLKRYPRYRLTADTTLTTANLKSYGFIIVDSVTAAAAVTLTLPTPHGGLNGVRFHVYNDDTASGTGYAVTVTSTDNFMSDEDSVVLNPGETAEFVCTQDGQSSMGYIYNLESRGGTGVYHTWTPTAVWATAEPTHVTEVYRYRLTGKTVDFYMYMAGTDGDGGAPTSFTLPITPKDVDAFVPCATYGSVNGTATVGANAPGAYIEAANATAASRILTMTNAQTCTDAQAYELAISGSYEID